MPVSPLISYALDGLAQCYMPKRGLWSFKRHFDGREEVNEARPAYDVFYSINVLLGLSKMQDAAVAAGIDPREMFPGVVAQLEGSGAPRYAYGTALWTAAALRLPAPKWICDHVLSMTSGVEAFRDWRAQEVGMLLCGVVAQTQNDASWAKLAKRARDFILNNLAGESGLFRDRAHGHRAIFGSFATQVYSCLGLYHFEEAFGDTKAGEAADACVKRLIELQGRQGEWPWFYHVAGGRVVDFYEVYSVHQHGMGPAILKHAMRRGVPGAKEALSRGFFWILGENELNASMLVPELSLIARSQTRRDIGDGRVMRAVRAGLNIVTGRDGQIDGRSGRVRIRPEMRSYELGWTFWSFGDDVDFPELTHHEAFSRLASREGEIGQKAGRFEPTNPHKVFDSRQLASM